MAQKLDVLAKKTFLENLLVSSAILHRKIKRLIGPFQEKDVAGQAVDEILYDAKFNFRKIGFHSEPEVHDTTPN